MCGSGHAFCGVQEKMIDLESDLEELHDSEQRWANKHKRSIEQVKNAPGTGKAPHIHLILLIIET